MTIAQISSITNAKLLTANQNDAIIIDTLCIDSRNIVFAQTALFICLVTENNNGHLYIADAYSKGIRCFLISETPALLENYTDCFFIEVPNTLLALQQLAAAKRSEFKNDVIGITGSNGKTIVKEWLFQLLDGLFVIARSPKSYNSQIGVALSVWELGLQHTIGIFEAGISQPKEMVALQKIIQPTIGIFTTIGEQHSENFSSIQEKIMEKLQLFASCQQLIYCADNEAIHQIIETQKSTLLANTPLFTWGKSAANFLQIVEANSNSNTTILQCTFKNETTDLTIPFVDTASIENACHCICTYLAMGFAINTLQEKLNNLQPIAMRLELKDGINNCTLINDSYNNDIGALHLAINFLAQQKENSKYTVILSDILQSSQNSADLYEEVAELLQQKNVTTLIGIGTEIETCAAVFQQHGLQTFFYPTTDAFIANKAQHRFADENILIKGARKFAFEKINILLEAKIHQTVLEVNLNALAENFNTYANLVHKDVAIMAMVKAFSYGSGGYEIANKLQYLGVDYLAVAYADEGLQLRESGITAPIMVMNPDSASFDMMIANRLEPEIYSDTLLQLFITACNKNGATHFPIHIKIDTGMHRLGFTLPELPQIIPIISNNSIVHIKSVFSHLAASDDPALDEYTLQQAHLFNKAISIIEEHITYPFYKHLCNTSGIVRHPNLHYNMVRLGVGLYGVDYSQLLGKKIKNISRLKTSIAQIKTLSTGDTVGYSRKGLVSRPSKIGTVCIGYADGVHRSLSNGKGKMLVRGTLCPIVGNVCMDMCMLDVTDVPNVQEGDEVIIFGPELPINRVAEMAGTIAYELMTSISARVKRVYFEE